tara:strand:+ start:892 stop:4686 length:3795 start_codon:yes stop_codon:yes gene_type:complete
MLPTNNGKNMPCIPVSSNCVIWQGPDIECINLCNGDTVSDIVGKLATELCALIDAACVCTPDLTGLTLDCITGVSDPTDLVEVLNAIIATACTTGTGTGVNLNVSEKRVAADGNILLPKCLVYSDEFGNPITELPINEFVIYLANEICGILNSIVLINAAIENFETRIGILENCVLPCVPQKNIVSEVVSTCLFPGQLKDVSILLLAIEKDFCNLRSNVGTSQDILNAIAAQCIFSTTDRLSASGNYGSNINWIKSPSNLSQSLKDQWVVICDLYSAIKDIQDNCCDSGCSGLNFGFLYNVISNSSNVPVTLNLNFTSSSLPASYSDCGGLTNVKITDSLGSEINQGVNVASLQNSTTGATINLAALNVNNSITVQVDFCATDGVNTCQEKQTIIVPLETLCPNDIIASGITEDRVTVSFTNVLGTAVQYKIDIVDDITNAVAATTTIGSPGFNISEVLMGLASGTNYSIAITVTSNAIPKICVSVPFTTTGVNCNNYSTNTVGAPGSNDIYLGYTDSGGVQTPYYYNPDDKVIAVGSAAIPTCYAPIINTNTINELTGDVTFDLSYGLVPGASILIESSIDGVTWLLPDSGADGVRVYASGITSGILYLRVQTDCTTSTSEYTIIRYDFITNQWQFIQSPSACKYDSILNACPAGVQVSQQYLGCGTVTYTVFSGGIDSYWFYIRKYIRDGVTIYVYAGWNQLTGVTTVVECCACPAFVLTEQITVFCLENNSTTITLPYVLGNGIPLMNVVTATTNGTLVQSTVGSNSFTYTHLGASNSYADTFAVEIIPQVVGDCESLTATIQIQIVPTKVKMVYQDQPLFVFIDSNSYSVADATDIKAGISVLTSQWFVDWGYTGTVYFIPTSSSRWLGYQKSIVDDGVSVVLSGGGYTALEVLPSSWTAGAPIYKNGVLLIVFSNDSDGTYHDATLASGFGSGLTVQPRTDYKDDFDALYDAQNGTNTSTWATSLGITRGQYPDGFSAVYYPLTTQYSGSADAASILQSLAAYTGGMIPPNQYGVKTAVDVTGYLLQGLVPSATNPYLGASTTGGNTLIPLYSYGFIVYLNNLLKTNTLTDIAAGSNAPFLTQLTLAAQDSTGTFPSAPTGTILFDTIRCSTGLPALIEYTAGAPYPAVNTTYLSLAANNSLAVDQYFHIVGYGLGAAFFTFTAFSVVPGCEVPSSQFRVADCTTGYEYDVEFGATVGVIPGNIYKLTNTGASFLPGAPDDWLTGQDRCITVISSLVVGLDITSITVVSTHLNCATCTP